MLGAGSGEILDVVGSAFSQDGRKVVGVEPTYSSVYSHATSVAARRSRMPLARTTARTSGDDPRHEEALSRSRVRLSLQPEQSHGPIVTKQEIKQLLDGLPEDMPVLIDEAYHHFVEDPGLCDVDPVRARGASGDRRAHVLEDRGAGRHAAGLRDRAARADPARCAATARAASTRS